MARRHEDATPWVGYADFLTTLAMLFVLIIIAAAAHRKRQAGFVIGTVTGVASQEAITSCLARLGANRQQRTDAQGSFEFRIDAIVEAVTTSLDVRCPGYGAYSELLTIPSGDTIRRTIRLRQISAITVVRLPGDALFGSSSY